MRWAPKLHRQCGTARMYLLWKNDFIGKPASRMESFNTLLSNGSVLVLNNGCLNDKQALASHTSMKFK
jgi:hypothetical protein